MQQSVSSALIILDAVVFIAGISSLSLFYYFINLRRKCYALIDKMSEFEKLLYLYRQDSETCRAEELFVRNLEIIEENPEYAAFMDKILAQQIYLKHKIAEEIIMREKAARALFNGRWDTPKHKGFEKARRVNFFTGIHQTIVYRTELESELAIAKSQLEKLEQLREEYRNATISANGIMIIGIIGAKCAISEA